MTTTKITYTFPADCKVPQLRGKTFTGGEFCRIDGQWLNVEPDAVRFAERFEGQIVMARIAGTPELEAALAARKAEQQAVADRLAAIGWPEYEALQRKAGNARIAYDRASDRGYPAREAEAMRIAEAALSNAREDYPLAAAYATAVSYSAASNYAKAAAGRRAMQSIEAGADPVATVEAMTAEWSAAADRAVANA